MARTKGATDKTKRKSKLIRNTALGATGTALVTGGGVYSKNVVNRVKVAKGLEQLDVEDTIKKATNASMLGKNRTADKLLAESTKKASTYAQNTNTKRALTIVKNDVKNIGKTVLGKIIRRGK